MRSMCCTVNTVRTPFPSQFYISIHYWFVKPQVSHHFRNREGKGQRATQSPAKPRKCPYQYVSTNRGILRGKGEPLRANLYTYLASHLLRFAARCYLSNKYDSGRRRPEP